MRVVFARVARYMSLLRGHSDFAHSSAGAYPLYRGAYVFGWPYAPFGGGLSPAPAASSAAAADAAALARALHGASASAGGAASTVLRKWVRGVLCSAYRHNAALVGRP